MSRGGGGEAEDQVHISYPGRCGLRPPALYNATSRTVGTFRKTMATPDQDKPKRL